MRPNQPAPLTEWRRPAPRARWRGTVPTAAMFRRGPGGRRRPLQARAIALVPTADLLVGVVDLERAAGLTEEEHVRAERRLAFERAVIDHRDQAFDLDVEVALLVHLAQQRVLDVLAVLDPPVGRRNVPRDRRPWSAAGCRRSDGGSPSRPRSAAAAAHRREVAVGKHLLDEGKLAVALTEPAEIAVCAHAVPCQPRLRLGLRARRTRRSCGSLRDRATSVASASASRSPIPGILQPAAAA